MRHRTYPATLGIPALLATSIFLTGAVPAVGQQQVVGNIVGHIRVQRGDSPPERVMVTLELRGAPMDNVYCDSSGTFGFHNLQPDPYYVTVDDEKYEPVRKLVVIDAVQMSPNVFVDIILVPKKSSKSDADATSKPRGSNPDIVDVREYSKNFPKRAVKEFEKGVQADADKKKDDAIRHYQKAVEIAPEFYLAHNNLGSDYQSKSDFPNALKEFERVVQLNQSDAAAYFNLSNVYMLTNNLSEARQNLDEGLRRQPDSALGQFLLGSLQMRLKNLREAEAALLRAIQLSPTMAQARLQLVNLFLQEGRSDAAEAQLRDFIAKLPDSPFAVQAKQVLQKLEGNFKTNTSN